MPGTDSQCANCSNRSRPPGPTDVRAAPARPDRRRRRRLVAPPVLSHVDVARIFAGAEGQVLDAVGAGLDVPHRVLVESDRVPLGDFDDLVVDLDAPRAAHDDVDLFLRHMLVTERHPEVRCQLQQAQAERLAPERRTRAASIHLLWHAELRRLVLDLSQALLRVSSHGTSLTPERKTENLLFAHASAPYPSAHRDSGE